MRRFFRWIRRAASLPPRRFRPEIESLESRTLLTAYTVTTTADLLNDTTTGQVTLRDVITAIDMQAASGNAPAGSAGVNTIDFRIAAAGSVQTIDLAAPLPAITQQVFIDGWSQGKANYAGPPLIVLNGAGAGSSADGLELDVGSNGSTVRGLVIQAFSANGIEIHGASNVQITANYLGTDATGKVAVGNGADAILIDDGATGNVIGGTARGAGNVICGSVVAPPGGTVGTETATFSLSPASISGSVASFNVTVNYTDAAPYQMVYVGVDLRNNSTTLAPIDPGTGQPDYSAFNFVPSSVIGANWEAISNAFPGEFLFHTPPATGGTPSGLAPNASYVIGTITYNLAEFGVMLTPSPPILSIDSIDTVIGAEMPGDPASFDFVNPNFNVGQQPIVNAAPTSVGVEIAGSGTTGNQVIGNVVGTIPTGTAILGQLSDGILIDAGAADNTVSTNTIGGSNTGVALSGTGVDGNSIVGNNLGVNSTGADLANTVAGILVENGAAGNTIGGVTPASGNTIAYNGKGVVIGNSTTDSATIHDTILGNRIYANVLSPIELGNSGPTPNGANPRSYPNDGQNTPFINAITPHEVSGSLSSVANTSFRIEVFANTPSGAKPGQTRLGFVTVTTDASGNANFTLPIAALASGDTVTATATNLATGDTSESSPIGTEIVILNSPTISSTGKPQNAVVDIEVLTASGPLTSGTIVLTVPGLPGQVTVTLNGKAVVAVAFPIPANAAAKQYTFDADVFENEDSPDDSAQGTLIIAASVSRRWSR